MNIKSIMIKGLLFSSIIGVGASVNTVLPHQKPSTQTVHASSVLSHTFVNHCKNQQSSLKKHMRVQVRLLHHTHQSYQKRIIQNRIQVMHQRIHAINRFVHTYHHWRKAQKIYRHDYRQYLHDRAIFRQRSHQVQRVVKIAHHHKTHRVIKVTKHHHENLDTILNHLQADDSALNNRYAETWLKQYQHNPHMELTNQTQSYLQRLNDMKQSERLLIKTVGNSVKPNLERLNHLL